MRKLRITISALFVGATACGVATAQISPTPVINNEIRDPSSIRMRSLEIERIKRDSKDDSANGSPDRIVNPEQVIADFEGIQKLQAKIVAEFRARNRARKIAGFAAEMAKRSARLDRNLFGSREIPTAGIDAPTEKLIIELDAALAEFVSSPMFADGKLVDQKEAATAEAKLQRIIALAGALGRIARK